MYLGGTGAIGAARGLAAAGLGAVRAGTAMGSAASTAYTLGQEASGSSSIGAGLSGMASAAGGTARSRMRSEEHTSELQSLMRSSYAVFCLKKKTNKTNTKTSIQH